MYALNSSTANWIDPGQSLSAELREESLDYDMQLHTSWYQNI